MLSINAWLKYLSKYSWFLKYAVVSLIAEYLSEKVSHSFWIIGLSIISSSTKSSLAQENTKNIDNIYKCTVVREPIQRVVSHYKFMVFKK